MNKLVLFCALACIAVSCASAFTLNQQQVVPTKLKSARITEIGNRIKKLSNSNVDASQFLLQAAQIQQLQQNGLNGLMGSINQPMLSSSSPMLSTVPIAGGQQNQMMAQRVNNMMPNMQTIQQTISNAIKPTATAATTNQFAAQAQTQTQPMQTQTAGVKTQQPVLTPQQILQQQQQLQQQQLQQQVLQQQQQLQQIQQQQQTAAKMSLPSIQSNGIQQQTLQSQIQKSQQPTQTQQFAQQQQVQPQQQTQQQQQQQFVSQQPAQTQQQQFVQQPTQTQQFAQTQPQAQTQQFTQQQQQQQQTQPQQFTQQPAQQTVQQQQQQPAQNQQFNQQDLEQTLRNFIQQQQNGQDSQAAQQQQQQFTQQTVQQPQQAQQQFAQQTVQQPQQTQQFVQQPQQTQTQFNRPQTTNNVQPTQTQTVQQPSKPTAQFVGPNTFPKKTTVNPVKPVVLDTNNIKTQIASSNMNSQQLPSNGVDIEAMCQTKINNERLSHPQNPSQFIICHPFGSIIMECPNHTVYNAALDKCDSSSSRKFTSVCQTTPCQNGGTCTELSTRSFQCTCPAGFIGSTCEIPDVCTQNNCGPNGICLPMQLGSPVQSYCSCFQNKALGLTCDKNSEPNPCLGPHDQDMHFPTRLGKNMYIQCEGDRPHLKFCSGPLVFHVDKQQCDWETA